MDEGAHSEHRFILYSSFYDFCVGEKMTLGGETECGLFTVSTQQYLRRGPVASVLLLQVKCYICILLCAFAATLKISLNDNIFVCSLLLMFEHEVCYFPLTFEY